MSKIRKFAKGQECTVRIPGLCNYQPETVVLAHIGGGGMGMKHNDMEAAFCCSSCHDAIDGRTQTEFQRVQLELWHHQGAQRTRKILLETGFIKIT